MAVYFFETITAAQAAGYNAATDTLVFSDETSASEFRPPGVTFNADGTVTLFQDYPDRHPSVTFGAGFQGETGIRLPVDRRILIGTTGSDAIGGTSSIDYIYAGPGDDTLMGGAGVDILYGGAGADLFVFEGGVGFSSDLVVGWDASDRLAFGGPAATAANVVELGPAFATYEAAYGEANRLVAQGVYDYVIARSASNVWVFVDSGGNNGAFDSVVTIEQANASFGLGNLTTLPAALPPPPPPLPITDTRPPPGAPATLEGTAGDDRLNHQGQTGVVMRGHAGNDTLQAIDAPDTLDGGAGDDILAGVNGRAVVVTYENATGGVTVDLHTHAPQAVGGGQGMDQLQDVYRLIGSAFGDTLTADGINSTTFWGEGGDDRLTAYDGANLFGGAGNDTLQSAGSSRLEGGVGNDVLRASGNGSTLDGGEGDDWLEDGVSLLGGEGADTLTTTGSLDFRRLDGGDGADQLRGSSGRDSLFGGEGDDSISAGAGADTINGSTGRDVIASGAGADRIEIGYDRSSPANMDVITDWSSEDQLVFNGGFITGRTYLEATAGDWAEARAVADAAIASGQANFVSVAVGADVLVFADSGADDGVADDAVLLQGATLGAIDAVNFTARSFPTALAGWNPAGYVNGNMDALQLADFWSNLLTETTATQIRADRAGSTLILRGSFTYGGDGSAAGTVTEVILKIGGQFEATFHAANVQLLDLAQQFVANATQQALGSVLSGPDALWGQDGADLIRGYSGNDLLQGGAGADSLFGGLGDDYVQGGSGNNFLRGEEGDDWIIGGNDTDDAHGNMGNDTVAGGAGDDWTVGGKDNDLLFGDDGHDVVWGNLGNDTCDGGTGNDQVRGGQGDDIVRGGAGDDWLSGDRGTDTITGGAGADIFHTFDGAGSDRVTDFNAGEGDRVYVLAGHQYSVAQVGADTVVTVTGAEGATLTLVGVTLSTLPDGWIFGG